MCCPVCGSQRFGRVGRERYFCQDCCHEWLEENGRIIVYKILADGTVTRIKSPQPSAGSLRQAKRRAG